MADTHNSTNLKTYTPHQQLLGTIIAHRAMDLITLEEANMLFRQALLAKKAGAPAPNFADMLAEVRRD